jgi:tetratricopeptide (TPR) repeat protein
MRIQPKFRRLAVCLCILPVHGASARAQNIPLGALSDWMFYDEGGRAFLAKGDYARAETQFRMAIEQLKPYPASNGRLMARSYCDLARVLYHQGRYAEAKPLAKWALSVRDADKMAPTDAVFQAVYTMALIYSAERQFPQAERLFKRALAMQEQVLPAGHANTLVTLQRLSKVYVEQGKYKEAEPLYLRAIAICERRIPDENLDLADTAFDYAAMLVKMNRPADAEKWQARALKIRDAVATKQAKAKADQAENTLKGFK